MDHLTGGKCEDWSALPDHIVIQIIQLLPLRDKYHTSLVCQSWSRCFDSQYIWTRFNFEFYTLSSKSQLRCAEKYGCFLQNVIIDLDQGDTDNRQNACSVLKQLANVPSRRLRSLEIRFMGENPYFYAGKEFIDALGELLRHNPDVTIIKPITSVLLRKVTVTFDDTLIDIMTDNHRNLQLLDLQNRALVCKISPPAMLRLIRNCKHLRDLRVHHCSLHEECLDAFTEVGRAPVQHLSILCRREEKYRKDIDGEAWVKLTNKYRQFRVTLAFDHTIQLEQVSDLMKAEIPVAVLRLETYTRIYTEVRLAARIYGNTLEKLVLETPLSRNSPELNAALIHLVTECKKLWSLHVYCILSESTIDQILELNPAMRERKTYTLKHQDNAGPAPWKGDELYIPGTV